MQRILHLIETSGPGGAERMLLSLLSRLQQADTVSVVCLRKDGWLKRQVEALGVEVILEPLDGLVNIKWIRRVAAEVRRRGITLIHSHEFTMNVFASIVSRVTGVPCISTVHGKKYYGDRARRRALCRFAARHATTVAVSEDVAVYLRDVVGVEPSGIVVIPNGIDVQIYQRDGAVREAARAELGYAPDHIVFGAIGNLYPIKGHRYLVSALAEVFHREPRVRAFIAGRGDQLSSLEAQARDLGLTECVRFLGYREDVSRLLQAMDVFVIPSESEGLPLSLLEAMAAEVPVVSTSVGGIPEVIGEDRGVLVVPRDPTALAEGMWRCVADPAATRARAENAHRVVVGRYSLDQMMQGYAEVYRAALAA